MNNLDLRYVTKVGICTLACSLLAAALVYLTFDLAVGLHLLRVHLV
jgi:hypothetical protein